jgi:hypothetical protein
MLIRSASRPLVVETETDRTDDPREGVKRTVVPPPRARIGPVGWPLPPASCPGPTSSSGVPERARHSPRHPDVSPILSHDRTCVAAPRDAAGQPPACRPARDRDRMSPTRGRMTVCHTAEPRPSRSAAEGAEKGQDVKGSLSRLRADLHLDPSACAGWPGSRRREPATRGDLNCKPTLDSIKKIVISSLEKVKSPHGECRSRFVAQMSGKIPRGADAAPSSMS